MEPKEFKARVQLKEGEGEAGTISALFSHFNSIDQSGDVVLPSFFTHGQGIPMAAWGHDWGSLPPGKGIIRVTDEGAIFDGKFFLKTPQGIAHYETIKEMDDLQEWSFGFRILEAQPGVKDGQQVRFLVKGETFEASPVLVGDNRRTYTQAIKSAPVPMDEQAEVVLAAASEWSSRLKSLADLRGKEGRTLSNANLTRIESLRETLRSVEEELAALIASATPAKGDDQKAAALAAVIEAQIVMARLHGVAA